MKKIIVVSLIISLTAGMAACDNSYTGTVSRTGETESVSTAESVEEKYPVHWDLSEIYENEDAWQADYDSVMEMFDKYDSFVGKINQAQNIHDYLEFKYEGELKEMQERLTYYANLRNGLDISDETAKSMSNKLSIMTLTEKEKTAFFDIELLAIPYEERIAILDDPILDEYRYLLSNYYDENCAARSDETIQVQSILQSADGGAYDAAMTILYLDMEDPEITLPDGTTIVMNDAEYIDIVSNNEYSTELKNEAMKLRLTKVLPYINTLATTLETAIKENYSYAQLGGYETTRAYLMDQESVDAEVFDLLIDNVHEMLPDYQRYLSLHAEALGLDEQHSYDLKTFVSDYTRETTSYDDAVDEVRDALQIFGDDYIDYYDAIVEDGHVDVYPAEGKDTGAFMTDAALTLNPYVLFNFAGSYDDVSTVAHEMGHAVYGSFSQHTQPVMYRIAGSFTHEVASTLNEIIFVNSKIESSSSLDEKLYYLENEIRLLNGTLFEQAMFAELEDTLYQLVENGEALTADMLNELFMAEQKEYGGDAVKIIDEVQYYWAQLPHLYYGYYLYKYASSISYAASIYSTFTGENCEEAINDYKEFLKSGSSAEPRDLLEIAGIDINADKTYEQAKEFYSSLIDQYEMLLKEKANQ